MSPHRHQQQDQQDIADKPFWTSAKNFAAILVFAVTTTGGGVWALAQVKGDIKSTQDDLSATKSQVATLGSSVTQDHDILLRVDGKLNLLLQQARLMPAGAQAGKP